MVQETDKGVRMKVIKRGETKDYSKFEMAVGNRVYKANHAAKIAKSIEENNMLGACPIVCIQRGKRMEVIDGQHRLGACKMLDIAVPYIIVDGVTAEDIARLNRDQKGWGSKDYLHHFCAMGATEYLTLAAFIEATEMPVTLAASLVSGVIHEGGTSNQFKEGGYKASGVEFAVRVFGELEKMREAGCTFTKERSLVKAIQHIMTAVPTFDASRLVLRMRYMPLEKRASWIDYCTQIERLYNYRAQKKNIVHIMAALKDAGCMKD
jgi:hypothetical protein